MSRIAEVLQDESRKVDPLFYVYYVSPSAVTAEPYVTSALSWAADASAALQAQDAASDPLFKTLGGRYDVHVKHLNAVAEAGHYPAGVKLPGFSELFAANVKGFGESVREGVNIGVKIGPALVIGAVLLLAFLYLAPRR